MKLRVLGSGTALPHARRGASGYALVADEGSVCLLECGPGSTRRWPSAGVTFANARIALVTHHHVDHCCDLPAVLFGRMVAGLAEVGPLALVGPIGHADHMRAIEGMFGDWVVDRAGLVTVHEMGDEDTLAVDPFELCTRHVRHHEGALGVRVCADGGSVAFSGDSGPCDSLVELCRGADLVLLECSYPAERETRGHLNARTAAEVAVQAGVSRLVLTHFYPACDDVDLEAQVRAAGYRGWLHLANDGDEILVSP